MHLKLSKGHNFKLSNPPKKEISKLKNTDKIIVHPSDFPYIKPKLLIKDGDLVKIGTPLFIDKLNPDINFVSPVSGNVNQIIYGNRRSIQSIIITNDENYNQMEVSIKNILKIRLKERYEEFLKVFLMKNPKQELQEN